MATKTESLVDRILRKRPNYDAEAELNKFLLDAYAGTGGFQGLVRQPFQSYWGWASDVYARVRTAGYNQFAEDDEFVETYLDRFRSEDVQKFKRRASMAHYANYIQPVIDIMLSYMFRKPMMVQPEPADMPESVQDFLNDANGAGEPYDDMLRDTIAPRQAVLGWCPVLHDMAAAIEPMFGEDGLQIPVTASDQAEGVYAVPLFPENLLDWSVDVRGEWRWVKVMIPYVRQASALDDPVNLMRVTVWTPETYQWWDIGKGDGGKPEIVGASSANGEPTPHTFGEVPIVVYKAKPVPDDPVRGIPLAKDASNQARRGFNLGSELQEFHRQCCYGFLQAPVEKGKEGELANMLNGNGNALPVPFDSSTEWKWVTPSPEVADILQKGFDSIIEGIFRTLRMDFVRGTRGGGQARSGISMAFEFEAANRAIGDFAANTAKAYQDTLRLVAVMTSTSDTAREEANETITVTPPRNFNVEEAARELEDARAAIEMQPGPTAIAQIKKRLVRVSLPNEPQEVYEDIDGEIDAERDRNLQAIQDDESASISSALRGTRLSLDIEREEDDVDDGENPEGDPAGALAQFEDDSEDDA